MRFVALWLCLLCVVMFVLQLVVGTDVVVLDRSLVLHEPWRIVTAVFAHGGVGHLLSNLFALGLFGLILEGRIGPKRVLWLFLISGVLINVFSPYNRSLGASGAIFAILGTLIVLRPFMSVWVSGFPMPMIVAGLVWAVQNVFGVFMPSDVGYVAHLSGLVLGVGMGFVWRKEFGDKREKVKRDEKTERELDRWEEKYMKCFIGF